MRALKKLVFILLIIVTFFSCISIASAQNILETNASLLDATIFSHGASLHHIAKQVAIPKGSSELLINQIAQNIDQNSIRVTSSGGQVSIHSVSFEKDYLVKGENKSTTYIDVKKKFDEATDELLALTNERKGEESTLALLEENRKFGGQSGVTPGSLSTMINYYRAEYKVLSGNILKLKKREDAQQQLVERLKKQVEEAGGSGQNAGQLVLKLHTNQAGKADFEIHYFTANVSWSPFYEIQVNSLNEPLHLVYKANVSQSTGIDWKQINLTFSNSNPRKNNNAPVLNLWWLRFKESPAPVQAEKLMIRQTDFTSALAGRVAGVGVPYESMAVMQENQLSTSFVVKTPYDIYSNKQAQAVILQDYKLPATYSYFTAPRLDEGAFLVSKLTNWEKLQLMPGNANLIIDNNYAGTSYINPKSTEDSLTISLGRDERIITKRERIDEVGSTSYFGSSEKRVYTYEINIRNTRNEAIVLDVKEQFPVSTEKDIEVKLIETSNAKVNAEKGELSWNVKLKAGETKKITISYSIKSPKDRAISGI